MKVGQLELESMIESLRIKKDMLEVWITSNNVVSSEETIGEVTTKLREHGDVVERLIYLQARYVMLIAKSAEIQSRSDYLQDTVYFIDSLPNECKETPFLMINSEVKWNQTIELTRQIAVVGLQLAENKSKLKIEID